MLWQDRLVGGLQRGAEIGDQRVDGEERRAALAFRPLAAGDGSDMGASALTEHMKGWRAVCVNLCPGGDVGVSERCGLRVGEAADQRHGDRAHAATRIALGGGDDAGLAGGAAALVSFAAEIDVVGLYNPRSAALGRRPPLAV